MLRCTYGVNGHRFGDEDFGLLAVIYADDCTDAALRAANGEYTNRLDCSIEYSDGNAERCIRGSDPSLLGYPSCESAAARVGGRAVYICPQYE